MARSKRKRYRLKGKGPVSEHVGVIVLLCIGLIVIVGGLYVATGSKGGQITEKKKKKITYKPLPSKQSSSTSYLLRPDISAGRTKAKVKKVLDGDTIVLEPYQRLRFIGVDTPEKDQPFSQEATQFIKDLLLGKEIWMEFDEQLYDNWGRFLAYVFVTDKNGREIFANEELLKKGLAYFYVVPPNTKYFSRLLDAFKKGRNQKKGMWAVKKPSLEPYYLVARDAYRFHRPSCVKIKGVTDVIRYDNIDNAYNDGKSPCRTCKP
jgi:endonuclease YncB( thermonuclease family)